MGKGRERKKGKGKEARLPGYYFIIRALNFGSVSYTPCHVYTMQQIAIIKHKATQVSHYLQSRFYHILL